MGGVRGDVISLTFMQTSIMEMGRPPAVQNADPAMWVTARQYAGRIVTISNAKIFDEPVFNYTRDFPFLWEEMSLPVSFKHDRAQTESILLQVAGKHTVPIQEMGEENGRRDGTPLFHAKSWCRASVYWRITVNWLELTVRFIVREHGVPMSKTE
jgi:hypothetical protein